MQMRIIKKKGVFVLQLFRHTCSSINRTMALTCSLFGWLVADG
jgi:hypothetical protein